MKFGKICRMLIGLYLWFTAIAVIVSFLLYSKDRNEIILNCILVVILLVIPGFILISPPKKKNASNNFNPSVFFSDVPKETLNSMKINYSQIQANSDIRVLLDSIDIINKTTNLETFITRYELALKKITNLEMAKYAGVRIKLPVRYPEVVNLINKVDKVLDIEYQNELKKINSLKTEKGKNNRTNKFICYLRKYDAVLNTNERYNAILNNLEQDNINNEIQSNNGIESIDTYDFGYSLDDVPDKLTVAELRKEIRILKDIINTLKTTEDFETFFFAYDLALDKCTLINLDISINEKTNIKCPVTQKYVEDLLSEADRIIQFHYQKALDDINSSDNYKTKIDIVDNYLNSMEDYEDRLEFFDLYYKSIEHLESLKEDFMQCI